MLTARLNLKCFFSPSPRSIKPLVDVVMKMSKEIVVVVSGRVEYLNASIHCHSVLVFFANRCPIIHLTGLRFSRMYCWYVGYDDNGITNTMLLVPPVCPNKKHINSILVRGHNVLSFSSSQQIHKSPSTGWWRRQQTGQVINNPSPGHNFELLAIHRLSLLLLMPQWRCLV